MRERETDLSALKKNKWLLLSCCLLLFDPLLNQIWLNWLVVQQILAHKISSFPSKKCVNTGRSQWSRDSRESLSEKDERLDSLRDSLLYCSFWCIILFFIIELFIICSIEWIGKENLPPSFQVLFWEVFWQTVRPIHTLSSTAYKLVVWYSNSEVNLMSYFSLWVWQSGIMYKWIVCRRIKK